MDFLKTPDFLFVQEIQDDSGPTNDGKVSANLTLTALADSIKFFSNVSYAFASVDPVDGQDGGQPGGNIRTAFLYAIFINQSNQDTNALVCVPGTGLKCSHSLAEFLPVDLWIPLL